MTRNKTRALGFLGGLALLLAAAAVPVFASSTGASATLDQCTNGPVGPPLGAQPCVGSNLAGVSATIPGVNGGANTSYKNWQNGNANGSKSHWREGEFISYRTIITGLGTSNGTPHSLVFSYDTVHSGGHALDYIGSFDATESTSSTPDLFGDPQVVIHANNNSPCADLVASGMMASCAPDSPTNLVAAPLETFTGTGGEQGCGNSPGTWTGAQESGSIKFFSPVAITSPAVEITSDNGLSGTGQCTTTVKLTWYSSALPSGKAMVIAWGGHIASQGDWGQGNSASYISGSPFHMSLNKLDGASTGSQDRALATSAIYFTPTVSTLLASTSVSLNGSTHDTVTLSGASNNAGGTVTYRVYSDSTCTTLATAGTGNMINAQPSTPVTVTNGSVPNSSSVTFQKSGSYYWVATYSGDGVNIGSHSGCADEPLTIKPQPGYTSTPSLIPEDSVTLSGGNSPTGTLTFSLYSTSDCSGAAVFSQTVTVTSGTSTYKTTNATNTTVYKPTAAGTYKWQISYSGDTNNSAFTGTCGDESFAITSITSKST